VCLIAAWSGCAIRQGPYNSQVVSITTDLQKTYTEFLIGIKVKGGSSPKDYKDHLATYSKIYAALSQLEFYSDLPTNNGLKEQIAELETETATLQNVDRESGVRAQFAENYLTKNVNRNLRVILALEVSAQSVGGASPNATKNP
jgi:hypothetical protein